MPSQLPTRDATAIFANTFLFEESAKLVIARELRAMAKARAVASTSSFIPRHHASCSQPFCQTWKLKRYVMVSCNWKVALYPFYLYRQNHNICALYFFFV
ncbi:Histone methylation protein [Phytophthora megakarya]|uniref:Histone methylation protein n=1 Tax=Phytophthora megakarya TaxID=4795 RepID=A0A225UDD5_9STRA|nr:Histone methylation protein [Phytophthora megakarya]